MDYSKIYDAALRSVLDALEHSLRNRLLADPVLDAGGTATNFKTTNNINYMINGKVYYKAATNNIAAPGVSTGSGEYRKVLITIDTSGTIATVAGTVSTVSQAAAVLPDVPANKVALGYLELDPSFTSGSSNVTSGMCKKFEHTVDVSYT